MEENISFENNNLDSLVKALSSEDKNIKIVSEEEFKINQQDFEAKLDSPIETKEFTKTKINWIGNLNNYKEAKERNIKLINTSNMFFIASCKNTIKGKPQLIYQTKQRISLIKRIEIKNSKLRRDSQGNSYFDEGKIIYYKFIDDKIDKRQSGEEVEDLCLDFWIYRLINNEYEFYLFSEKKLDEVSMIINGMEMSVSDLSELNENLKLKKISRIFFVKEVEKDIRLLPKEELIEFCKEMKDKYGWDKQKFMDFIFTNEDEKQYNYSDEFKNLRIAQLLSGKYEGYPLHMMKMGPVGTGKTTEAETLAWKFNEDEGILEAGNSTFKALVPSFKEKPANLGYIAKCNRIATIDEMMKMVQKSLRDGNGDHNIYFGELNMLLEHKERKIGSGNDNSVKLKNNSKVLITTNPLEKRYNLAQHLNYIDSTTISRMLIWVQDWEEVNQIYSKTDIKENKIFAKPNNYTIKSTNTNQVECNSFIVDSSEYVFVDFSKEEVINDFLTIYDSCNNFLIDFHLERVRSIFQSSCNQVKQELKPIWSSRGLHHLVLILDGITKLRCLFENYDLTFTPIEEDYLLLEKIINKMIKNWDTQFQTNILRENIKVVKIGEDVQ